MTLNRQQYQDLVKIIRTNKAKFIERQSNRLTVWEVEYTDQKLFCVYDSNRHKIVTFLRPEWINKT